MLTALKEAWAGLSKRGRAFVLIAIVLVAGILVGMAMAYQYDLSWLPSLLGS